MPLIDRIDGPNRLIYLTAETANTTLDLQELYREERALRRTDETLRRFWKFLIMEGNIPKGGGTFTERYLVLLRGTRIIPWDIDSQITINTTLIGEDGSPEGPGQFDRTGIASNVDIDYRPLQVELIEVGGNCPDGSHDLPAVAFSAGASLIGDTTLTTAPATSANGAARLT